MRNYGAKTWEILEQKHRESLLSSMGTMGQKHRGSQKRNTLHLREETQRFMEQEKGNTEQKQNKGVHVIGTRESWSRNTLHHKTKTKGITEMN